jgi:hypothetical protein
VKVLVLNGWTTYHAALYFETKLFDDGYNTLAPTDAATSDNKTSVLFVVKLADEPNALALAQLIGVAPANVVTPTAANDSSVPAGDLGAKADLVLVVGEDISGQVPPKYNGATTTTTTPAA